jgi:hypothetical protein
VWTERASTRPLRRGQPRRSGCSISVIAGPRFEPARLCSLLPKGHYTVRQTPSTSDASSIVSGLFLLVILFVLLLVFVLLLGLPKHLVKHIVHKGLHLTLGFVACDPLI